MASLLDMSSSPPVEAADREDAEAPDLSVAELTQHAWLDRDLSWLEFNRRVLAEALDGRNRLLERVKFLAIFSSNLDEFFMKRMALIRPPSDDTSLAAEDRRDLSTSKASLGCPKTTS
jgi:polyphosphate kinase